MIENNFDAKKQREFTKNNISEAGFSYKEDEYKEDEYRDLFVKELEKAGVFELKDFQGHSPKRT
jgi:hypothetical protein